MNSKGFLFSFIFFLGKFWAFNIKELKYWIMKVFIYESSLQFEFT